MRVSAEHKHDFVAAEQSTSLMAALDGVIHKLEQQLRKYKEKVQDHHRTTAPRHEAASLEGEPAASNACAKAPACTRWLPTCDRQCWHEQRRRERKTRV